jgi:hypothetical protein
LSSFFIVLWKNWPNKLWKPNFHNLYRPNSWMGPVSFLFFPSLPPFPPLSFPFLALPRFSLLFFTPYSLLLTPYSLLLTPYFITPFPALPCFPHFPPFFFLLLNFFSRFLPTPYSLLLTFITSFLALPRFPPFPHLFLLLTHYFICKFLDISTKKQYNYVMNRSGVITL